jgi:hypothetical protein
MIIQSTDHRHTSYRSQENFQIVTPRTKPIPNRFQDFGWEYKVMENLRKAVKFKEVVLKKLARNLNNVFAN